MRIGRGVAVLLAACSSLPIAAADSGPRGRPLEAQVLDRINEARQHPRAYADALREYRRYFEGDILYLPGDANGVYTREGVAAVDEAIDFLERQAPLPPLDRGDLLALAAQDHADDQGAMGATGHRSGDGAGPGERVRRRGGDIFVGESISYGMADADAVVRQLIVDDGVPGRGHRALLFKGDFRFAGVGCGGHRRYGAMCVVDLAATADGKPALTRWAGSAAPANAPVRARAR
ncbi:uncharacterized protein YkwD [Sphingomonas naasensis]|uniref:CAP domain-containing protein n=1 Tax=Sphingomonas naasensis TaxID=1344951 RepID=UPI0019D12450|nr:CAP domain-containing protein [Sphingomonas naasensis]NIJ20196.1 uncharacterized protein YkwD [Sphingomonas naasensis]